MATMTDDARDLRTRVMTALHDTIREIDTIRGKPAGRTGREIAHFNSERLADAVLAEIDDGAIDRMAKHYIDETHVKALEIRNGANLELQPAQDMVALWVAAARTMLGDAENYSETPVGLPSVSIDVKLAGEYESFTLTVQRAGKLTPHQARERAERQRDELQDLLASIWLYAEWRWITRQLTTEQKELWADAVDANAAIGQLEDGEDVHPVADRWWRDA
jgi:hypothetical protein